MTRIDNRYHGSFTLMDAINDPLIHDNLEKFYVPQIDIRESIFLKKDESITVTDEGPKKIRFIYLNQSGINITSPDASFIQIPKNNKGFLARLSVSRNYFTPEYLELDYLVDISNIKYQVFSEYKSQLINGTRQIVLIESLKFENLEIHDYPNIQFDREIKEFILNKGQLFARYFK